ncbi:MAG: uracil phosphoribosyltransferase [Chloroflexi bacterium]|nr:uracil phosphoribosyltransferase [Chloroflexota bacterium]
MLFASEHPLVRLKVSELRNVETGPARFRELVRELSLLLGYEALRDLPLSAQAVCTPLTETTGYVPGVSVGLVPILRAGLGMVDGFLALLPTAEVWHLGLYRDEETLRPVEYYNRLSAGQIPSGREVHTWIVLDPMLATGGSAIAAVEVLKRGHPRRVKYVGLIAAPEGVHALQAAHPDVPIHVGVVDEGLNEHGYIVPGLGDAGDRQFAT